MIEVAVAYLGAYLGRKGFGLLERAGSDLDTAIDAKLSQLYDWVKGKLTGQPAGEASLRVLATTPDGADQQALVADHLASIVADDDTATQELAAFVAELDRLRPPGTTIEGLARAEDLYGEQIGVEANAWPEPGTDVTGTARATTVHKGGKNVGVKVNVDPGGKT